jgi:RND family efflux transporter MFP subunit
MIKELENYKADIEDIKNKIRSLEDSIRVKGGVIVAPVDTISVSVVQANRDDLVQSVELAGKITSKQNVIVSTDIAGTIKNIKVREGQVVTAGQVIAELDDEVVKNNIAELRTALELSSAVFDRRKKLWDQSIGSEIDYLQAKNNKETLERKLETANSQLDKSYIKAPISGTIDEVFANTGEMATPGVRILRIINLSEVQVEVDVSEAYVGKVKKGDVVTVSFPALKIEKTAKVSAVGQVINPTNRTFKIEANINNSENLLKANLLANIRIVEGIQEGVVLVPTKLVQYSQSGTYVYVIENNQVKKLEITTQETYDGKTVISEGLEGNELLVDKGFREVYDGAVVRIAN